MSTKLLRSLADEKTDMQKQLGCMNGIFQLFHRSNFPHGQRAIGHKQKMLPGQNVNHVMDQKGATEKILVRKERPVAPVELSRTSFSSTCSSSTFSSADCSKTAQSEPSSSCQSSFPETTSPTLPIKQPKQSLDLRDIVKDSMYREARGSVKITAKDERERHALKHIDSPRPQHQQKSVQPKVTRHDKSLRVLGKLRDAPLAPRDSPRYSYDERVSRERLKSITNLKELPRLSLDSRERSIRSSASQSKSNNSREIDRKNVIPSQILNLNQEPGSNKRPSIIVARLMGLEPIHDLIPTDEDQMMNMESCQNEDSDKIPQVFGSPRVSCKNLSSPRLRNENSAMKSSSSSRFPLEPAPWRQTGSDRGSQNQALKYQEASTKSPHASPSVYGEIEKRLTELEFKRSGKDLRALKQILEAMEKTRERLENKIEEQTPNLESHTSKCSPYNSFDRASTQQRDNNNQVSSTTKGSSSLRRCGSQILIMKQAKLTEKHAILTRGKPDLQKTWSENAGNIKDLVGKRTPKEFTPRKNHLRDSSSWSQPSIGKKTKAETLRSAQHPKVPIQSSDLRRARKQSIKQPMQSGSPTRKYQPKASNLQRGDDTVSMQSESGTSLPSRFDTQITSTDHTNQITGPYQPKDDNEEDFTSRLIEDKLTAEIATTTLEQPSPVSVLDTTFCEEDFLSPVKKISTAFQDYDTLYSDEAEWNAAYIDHFQNSRRPHPSSKFDQKKLENIDHLVHKLRPVNAAQDKATRNCIESLHDITNPDHRYIAEILLVAGFLVDLGSSWPTTQLHPSGLPINPNLFHVLEKAIGNTELADKNHEKSARSKSNEKNRRKLVFDIVNEILARMAGSVEPWIFQKKMAGRSMSGEKLLEELCSKIDHQQAILESSEDGEDDGSTSILSADMTNGPENWVDYSSELPGIVLDIERLIFKDLISEVVSGGAAGLQVHPGRFCRKLFPK